MAANIENELAPLRALVKEQGDLVRQLKQNGAPEFDVKKAVTDLKARKKVLEDRELELTVPANSFDRSKMEDLLKQRFFYDQSFAIYGGITGLYDFGPMGCAMKANFLANWRQFFVLEEHMLEVDCAMLTPETVLKASGHVERFTDFMVKDLSNGECFRADHLVQAGLEKVLVDKKATEESKEESRRLLPVLDNLSGTELGDLIQRFSLRSPSSGAELSAPQEFNLMFSTSIGPTGLVKGFLRPETSQGIFVNFQRLLQFNQGRLPFAAAQIGNAFRNEIAPRSGLIRVREFTMAEIEYFRDPRDQAHAKFGRVRDTEMNFYSAGQQMAGQSATRLTIGEAVASGLVAGESLGYFMARIALFVVSQGVDPARLRFRQHLGNEMAHYACDCWDAECLTSYGWVECVGCADRSCYDLQQHARATGTKLCAEKQLAAPELRQITELVPAMAVLGKAFKTAAKPLAAHLKQMSSPEAAEFARSLAAEGAVDVTLTDTFRVTPDMVTVKSLEKKFHVEEVVPSVIEPSFGVGRLLYAIFEHSFRVRADDEQRTYLALPPAIAPYKCSVLPLSSQPEFAPVVAGLSEALTAHGVSHRVDESGGGIGRRYARTDQIAIPFGITVDFDTLNKAPATATLRERDSMRQVRAPVALLPGVVAELAQGRCSWEDVLKKYPAFEAQETSKNGAA